MRRWGRGQGWCPLLACERHRIRCEVLRWRTAAENTRALGAHFHSVRPDGVMFVITFALTRRCCAVLRNRRGTGTSSRLPLCLGASFGTLGTCPAQHGWRHDAPTKLAVCSFLLPKPPIVFARLVVDRTALGRARVRR